MPLRGRKTKGSSDEVLIRDPQCVGYTHAKKITYAREGFYIFHVRVRLVTEALS